MPKQTDSEVDIQGIFFPNNGKLNTQEKQAFREVFQFWCILARRYANRWGWGEPVGTWKEVHWWYRERAHVGIFASAVWMAGGVALEEYGSEKTAVGEGGAAIYKGRTDLCFSLPLPGRDYVVETKHVPSQLPYPPEADPELTPVLKGLGDACQDAKRHGRNDNDKKLGMAFVTLDFAGGVKDRAKVTQSIHSWIRAAQDNDKIKKCLAISWFFPSEARLLLDETTGKPGTALFVAEADEVASFK